jgi:hypothetical protein
MASHPTAQRDLFCNFGRGPRYYTEGSLQVWVALRCWLAAVLHFERLCFLASWQATDMRSLMNWGLGTPSRRQAPGAPFVASCW